MQMLAVPVSQTKTQEQFQFDPIEKRLETIPKKKQRLFIAQDGTQKSPLDRAQERAKKIQDQLKSAASEVESISESEVKILSQLNDTEKLLNQIRREMSLNRTELSGIEIKLKQRQTDLTHLEKIIVDREAYLANRLVALYKLSWLGQLPILATSSSASDFFRRKASIEHILNYDQLEIDQLQQKKEAFKQRLVRINAEQSEKKRIETQLADQENALKIQLDKRKQFLTRIKTRKKLQLAAIRQLEQAAETLAQTISTLSESPSKSADKTPLSGQDFSKLKGLLNLPVEGKIIYFYGPYKNQRFDVVNFRTGITIQADRGEPIRSVGNGVVIYADWFRGYGNMIIIDHGNRYYTVYAHLEEIFKSNNKRVEVGEVIATVGDTGSMDGAGLHFEVRHHGKPLDPMEWIQKG